MLAVQELFCNVSSHLYLSALKPFASHSLAFRSDNGVTCCMQVSYQPEYHLGWRHHDQNYAAYRLFLEQLLKDNVTR